MRFKFLKGMTTGTLIGTTATIFIVPQLDRKYKKGLKRSSKHVKNAVESIYYGIKELVK